MTDRRPSLIDQMALAAALEADLELSTDDSDDEFLDDDDLDHPNERPQGRMVFNTDVPQEAGMSDAYAQQTLMPRGFQRRHPPTSNITLASDPAQAAANLNMSSSSDSWEMDLPPGSRRQSFSEESLHSAPARAGYDAPSPGETMFTSGGGGSADGYDGMTAVRRNSHTIRRPSVNIKKKYGDGSDDESPPPSIGSSSSGLLRFGRLSGIGGGRRQSASGPQSRNNSVTDSSLKQALDNLSSHGSNSEWENVAAAVTVVAAGAQGGAGNSKSRHIKFAVNDTVLVLLTLLNVTNMEDPKDTFTVAPVNRCGFPQGEGRTEEERCGPYTFVLATVTHVHFDEDDRYYTIVRADTGTEQRADSGWIEPLKDPVGIDAANRAARRTVRSAQDRPLEEMEETGYFQDFWGYFLDIISWPIHFFQATLLPWYQRLRARAKHVITQLVFGDAAFSCTFHFTGINFLVFCSFCFCFLEFFSLAFLPANYDQRVAFIGLVIWIILVLELVFEVAIRPKGYFDLLRSDRAFAPSTARHINTFHVIFEAIALATFLPEFRCLTSGDVCHRGPFFGRVELSIGSVIGDTPAELARARFAMGINALRLFGLVRHWKQMFINNTFRPSKRDGIERWLVPQDRNLNDSVNFIPNRRVRDKKNEDENESMYMPVDDSVVIMKTSEEDQRLRNAATIGTALMAVNSQRALILLMSVVILLPLLQSLAQSNQVATNMVKLLQSHNVAAPSGSEEDCAYLQSTVESWLRMAAAPQPEVLIGSIRSTYVLWAQLLPVRCDFQGDDGVITICGPDLTPSHDACYVWDEGPANTSEATPDYFASRLTLRAEAILPKSKWEFVDDLAPIYNTTVIFNENPTMMLASAGDFFLLFGFLLVALYGLTALRGEAIRLVLGPLQRMLKIVLRYAENPLSQDVKGTSKKADDDSALDVDAEEIGNYETEQLINAITKIADLLRKCWGVAGAGIISSNLARTKDGKTVVFNPTVPGKRVYALFGFVAINGFSEQLRALDRDVMILINDVAKVVHDEVYRWALGDHGQCNKNLGSAFLMVFRIGDFSEVHKKKQVATEKLFRDNAKVTNKTNANLRRRHTGGGRTRQGTRKGGRHQDVDGQLQLASLPGIQSFTDRALLGMLKSFAGVHRDKQLTDWKTDFRLSAGVSDYHVDIIYGMDAGWAVEGAVGSEYKIDATYLSPHVNMASRMMSATKQYGVTILLSKAVQELLSLSCREKLRHLDTVYVKGSKVKQEIFTFDARYQGVDFFLLERTPEQADLDAEAYTPNIWDHDQDLRAMRQHVSDEFMEIFRMGVKQYLAGKWVEAYATLECADNVMMETILADGYLEYDMEEIEGRLFDKKDQGEDIVHIRNELGDGACRALMTFMERRQLNPPDDWDAVRQLNSK